MKEYRRVYNTPEPKDSRTYVGGEQNGIRQASYIRPHAPATNPVGSDADKLCRNYLARPLIRERFVRIALDYRPVAYPNRSQVRTQ